MKNLTLFQGVIIAICVLSAIGGLALFASFEGGSKDMKVPITVWGTYPSSAFANVINDSSIDPETGFADLTHITYEQKNVETFDSEFVEALAVGVGPDLVFLDHDSIYRNWNKLAPVTYVTYSERLFKDTYVQGADVNRDGKGIRGFPVTVDPLVLYWNRDIFTTAGIVTPPKTWTEFLSIVPELSKTDSLGTVYQSAAALGEFDNITHAKDILTTLILQTENPIVIRNESILENESVSIEYSSVLANASTSQISQPSENALQFYAQYSDPSRELYSWNKSLENDKDLFLQGDVAMYFGKASEFDSMKKKNPNLNFEVTPVPQRTDSNKIVIADYQSLAVPRGAKNLGASYAAIQQLLIPPIHKRFAEEVGLPSTRRDLLLSQQPSAHDDVFYESALYSGYFIDVNPRGSELLFEEMLESYTTGARGLVQSVANTSTRLNVLVKEFQVKLLQ